MSVLKKKGRHVMYCNSCGSKLPDGAEFCTNCGAKQGGKGTTSPNTQRKVNIPPPQVRRNPSSSGQGNYSQEKAELITTKEYILMMVLFAIPIVGIVFMFIWGFGSDTPINKKNYARAMLIFMAIAVAISIIISVIMGVLTASIMSSVYY